MADYGSDSDRSARRHFRTHNRDENRNMTMHSVVGVMDIKQGDRIFFELKAKHQTPHQTLKEFRGAVYKHGLRNLDSMAEVGTHLNWVELHSLLTGHKDAHRRIRAVVNDALEVVNDYLVAEDKEGAWEVYKQARFALQYEIDDFKSFRESAIKRLSVEFKELEERYQEEVEGIPSKKLRVAASNRHIPKQRRD